MPPEGRNSRTLISVEGQCNAPVMSGTGAERRDIEKGKREGFGVQGIGAEDSV